MNLTVSEAHNPKQSYVLIKSSPATLGFALQELVQEGWEIDPQYPVTQLGFDWEVTMTRTPTNKQLADDLAKPLSRAEILTKARAAKAANVAQRKELELNV